MVYRIGDNCILMADNSRLTVDDFIKQMFSSHHIILFHCFNQWYQMMFKLMEINKTSKKYEE